jgi:hypothetical protein
MLEMHSNFSCQWIEYEIKEILNIMNPCGEVKNESKEVNMKYLNKYAQKNCKFSCFQQK